MARARKLFCKSIFGDTQKTLEAIQRFINQDKIVPNNSVSENNETPSTSVNRIINSVVDEGVTKDVDKIIKNI